MSSLHRWSKYNKSDEAACKIPKSLRMLAHYSEPYNAALSGGSKGAKRALGPPAAAPCYASYSVSIDLICSISSTHFCADRCQYCAFGFNSDLCSAVPSLRFNIFVPGLVLVAYRGDAQSGQNTWWLSIPSSETLLT